MSHPNNHPSLPFHHKDQHDQLMGQIDWIPLFRSGRPDDTNMLARKPLSHTVSPLFLFQFEYNVLYTLQIVKKNIVGSTVF